MYSCAFTKQKEPIANCYISFSVRSVRLKWYSFNPKLGVELNPSYKDDIYRHDDRKYSLPDNKIITFIDSASKINSFEKRNTPITTILKLISIKSSYLIVMPIKGLHKNTLSSARENTRFFNLSFFQRGRKWVQAIQHT